MSLRLGHKEQDIGEGHSSLQEQRPPLDSDSSSKEILRYIDQMLMEEDMDDNTRVLEASSGYQEKVRSFYELLDQKFPSPVCDHNNYFDYSTTNISGYVDDQRLLLSHDHMYSNRVGVDASIIKSSSIPSKRIIGTNDNCNQKNDCKQTAEQINDKLLVVPTDEFDDDVCNVYTLGGREMEFTTCFEDLKISDSKQKLCGKGIKARNCRAKKHKAKAAIDINQIMMNCAESLGADDHRAVTELLRQIRRHSTPNGDGNERLAHYFANGLEARLAGTGNRSLLGESPINERSTASDNLKVYCVTLMAFGVRKACSFASSKLIASRSKIAERVHVVDFGISYGFQWPLFIRRLAGREGGPPKLRITCIDYPQSGPQPAEKIEEAGRRLARYAKAFGVPFEYNALAQNWESVKVEDLKIEEGEFVAVNCLFGCKNLPDDRGYSESSKGMVLELIKRINPDIFVHGIVNGGYGVPYFFHRFREALYHFSALFDMLETFLPRERVERMVIERDMFGCEIMNVLACEGSERVERPETYKQWQVRHLKADFKQLRFERELIDTLIRKVGNCYNGNFVIDEDNKWLLFSWKGRVTHAISCWQPSSRLN